MTTQGKTPLRKLIEAVDGGTFTYHDVHNDWPSDIWPNIEFAYEGSLDAAKALHEALLPGLLWQRQSCGQFNIYNKYDEEVSYADDTFETPSRAWLLAILRAYEAQQ